MRNQEIKAKAIEVGMIDGYEYWVVPAPMVQNALNGYLVFPKRPVWEKGYWGILTYVPVHGGITYAHEDELGMVYGFDTLHCDSDQRPRTNKDWIKEQCEIMLKGILKAKEVESKYLRCVSREEKVKYCQQVNDIQPQESRNFGVIVNLLSGEL